VVVIELRSETREEATQLFQIGVPVVGIATLPEPEWVHEFKGAPYCGAPISIGEIADRVVRISKE